jgi:hypothetical protein
LLLPATSQAQARVNLFAGNWSTFGGSGTLQLQVTDAAHGQPAVAFYSEGTAACPSQTTYYTGAYTAGSDSGQVAGCTDPPGKNLDGWYKSGAGSQFGSFSVTGYVDPNTFAGTYHELSDGTSGPYNGAFTGDTPSDGCCPNNPPPKARIAVGAATIELLRPDPLRASVTPAGPSIADFKFELKRAQSNDWHVLADSASATFPFVGAIAGHFDVRVVATVAGQEVTSPSQRVVVQFPSERDIYSDARVRRFLNAAWQATLRLANRATRREEGFWIRLDTCTRRYLHTRTLLGPAVGPRQTGSVEIGSRPADSPANPPLDGCATYTVASFHTHTPTAYRPFGRGIGPSPADNREDRHDDVTGLVYDYLASPQGSGEIPAHYPLDRPAGIYQSGPDRRNTPP